VLDCYSQNPQAMRGLPSADPGTADILPCYSATNNKHRSTFICRRNAYKILVEKLHGKWLLGRNMLRCELHKNDSGQMLT
jgi:hypothetical protein